MHPDAGRTCPDKPLRCIGPRRRPGRGGLLRGLAIGLVLATGAPSLGALPSGAGPAAPSKTVVRPRVAAAPQSRMLLRVGDAAPVQARVAESFAGTLGFDPSGRLTCVSASEYSLESSEAGEGRIVLHAGDWIPGCATLDSVQYHAAGADGTRAVFVQCRLHQAVLRVEADGTATVAFAQGETLQDGSDVVEVVNLEGTAVDGQGTIVTAVNDGLDSGAIVRRPASGAREILIAAGDAIGAGTYVAPIRAPAVNAGGKVVFAATTSLGTAVIATLDPGGTPDVLFSVPVASTSPFEPNPLGPAPPAINDAGVVAFLFGDAGDLVVQRVAGGVVHTVAKAGDPAPGGDTFARVNAVHPAVDAAGGVIFGATLASGPSGLFRSDGTVTAVAVAGDPTGGGAHLLEGFGDGGIAPLPCADGAIRFVASDSIGAGVFAAQDGAVGVELRAGTPMQEPARYRLLERSGSSLSPYQSAGPFLAPGGAILFDAVVSGRGRGLYARAADGTVLPVAIDGDAAPGGGHFDGLYFAFHSIEPGGKVAFLGATPDGPTGTAVHLFTGVAGGPLSRIVGGGDVIAGHAAPISALLPPSPINVSGEIVVPAVLADGGMLLLGWDGTGLDVIAATGDALPGGGSIADFRLGQSRALLAPLLDDAGRVVFGATAAGFDAAIYATTIGGGAGASVRLLGAGDPVQGGTLQPFLLQALAADRVGRLALQAVPAPGPDASTYSADAGPVPRLVVDQPVPGWPPPPPGGVTSSSALPRLAATSNGGVVHEARGPFGRRLLFATPRVPADPDPATAYDQVTLVGAGVASPDGGEFVRAFAIGPGVPSNPPVAPVRLGSDGDRFVAAYEPTSINSEILVLWDLRPDQPPVAEAGADQTVECTGPDGAVVTLDATGSSDPENTGLEATWTGPFGTATGITATVTLPLGRWTVTLEVRDAGGMVATDTVVIEVRDTVAPSITVRALPDRLWPPDGRMTPVFFAVSASDLCDPGPAVELATITCDDPRFDPGADVAGADFGTDDRGVLLRARRTGGIGGRLYTATYQATDGSGNRAPASAVVLVPQSNVGGRDFAGPDRPGASQRGRSR